MLIVADDTPRNERELKAGEMACPDCKGELRPWGHARPRRLRMLSGSRVIRPRRSCCRACGRTHVLIPGVMLPRRADGIRVIGKALLEHVAGHGHRPIAARLRRPAATVRGWIRAFAARAEQTLVQASLWMLRLDVRVVRIEPDPTATPAAQALEVMAGAVAIVERSMSHAVCRWEVVSTLSAGLLLANTNRPYPSLD